MNPRRSTPPWPGPGRLTLALLAAVPAALAYPWASERDRWVLAVAAVVLIVLLGRWQGLPVTTILGRRAAMLRPHRGAQSARRPGPDVLTTVLLWVIPSPDDPGVLPLPLIAGYLDRYGLRADAIRVTSRDTHDGSEAPRRDTWIGLTFSAADNLAALQGRSPQLPLQETAEVAARRLADHLRETGWELAGAGPDDVSELPVAAASESWRALTDGDAGYLAAYRIGVDDALPGTFAEAWSVGAQEIWTAVEFAGTGEHPSLAAACAFRTAEHPAGTGPVAGLVPQNGRHLRALQALRPLSGLRLDAHTQTSADRLAAIRWPTAPGGSAASGPRAHPRHQAATRT